MPIAVTRRRERNRSGRAAQRVEHGVAAGLPNATLFHRGQRFRPRRAWYTLGAHPRMSHIRIERHRHRLSKVGSAEQSPVACCGAHGREFWSACALIQP